VDADPAQVNITMFDKDHFDFVAPPQKTMTGQGRYRRAGRLADREDSLDSCTCNAVLIV